MKSKKIAILGTRGIPNNYGGFEQFAEYLSVGLVQRGHQVSVYNPSFHPYRLQNYKGVMLVNKYSPEKLMGSTANFLYDYLCLRDALLKENDIILECGYQSAAISYYLCNINKSIIVTNMDGMEWWRAKWNPSVKKMTRWFEKLAAKKSHCLVADNIGIRRYLLEAYGIDAYYIPYGSDIVVNVEEDILKRYSLKKHEYDLIIARLEEENNIEIVLRGFLASGESHAIVVVGKLLTKYGRYLTSKYSNTPMIRFLDGIYNKEILDSLRYYSRIYFHGHSVGGTNPSLLEAMSCRALIAAHENIFNRSILGDDAFYFNDPNDVKMIMKNDHVNTKENIKKKKDTWTSNNINKIRSIYNWEVVVGQYERLFHELMENKVIR